VRDMFEKTDFFRYAQVSEDKAKDMAKVIREMCLSKLKGFELSPAGKEGADLDVIIGDLNRLCVLKDIRKVLPADILAKRGKSALKTLETYLAAPDGDASELAKLNHRLLLACFDVMPKDRWVRIGGFNWDHTASGRIAVLNRHTGKLLWQRDAVQSFTHNTIIAGGGKVFCIDATPTRVRATLARRGKPAPPSELLALDIRSGKPVWSDDTEVFGTWLAWSAEHDALVESGRPSRDMVTFEESSRMVVRRAADGKRIWPAPGAKVARYAGPVILHGDRIITQGAAIELLTGKRVVRKNPLTGQEMSWAWRKHYGCGTAVSSEHLLTFRSAAAGFYDLAGDGGTANLSGFKSSCTSNLIPADGVLNAPDYTRTCRCSYQNQTSLAFVHTPDVETWAFGIVPKASDRQMITRLGINLGAPGQRLASDGTLWVNDDGPHSSPSPVRIAIEPAEAVRFRHHSMTLCCKGLKWVRASGVEGIRKLSVRLAPDGVKLPPYTVRLHFREPSGMRPGARVFSVAVQGRAVIKDLDIAGDSPHGHLVKQVDGVTDCNVLTIELTPSKGSPVLCGVEAIAQP
jgi:putative pyrroloquinoline-quinone binding quinoprotein/malectin (di-glucose binding ER protein)